MKCINCRNAIRVSEGCLYIDEHICDKCSEKQNKGKVYSDSCDSEQNKSTK